MTIEQRIYDGNRAREVLDNEAFQWAFDTLKQEIIESWQGTSAKATQDRELMWASLKLLDKLEATLRTRLETGMLAKLELEHRQTLAERAREWLG